MQAVRPETLEGAELVSVNSFMRSREGASQNPLLQSFMDMRTKSPALSLDNEEDKAPKKSDSIYDMDGVLTEEQKLRIQYMGGRAGSSIESYDRQHEEERRERDKKDQAARLYMQQQAQLLQQLTTQLSEYQQEHSDAVAELAELRRQAEEAQQRSAQSAERFESATERYEERSQDTADFRTGMGEQIVTINGKDIRMEGGVLLDENGTAITAEDLANSDHPMAADMQKYLEDQRVAQIAAREQYVASRTQLNADVEAKAAEAEAVAVEERVEELEQKIEETETQIQEIQENNPELAAATEAEPTQDVAEASHVITSPTTESSFDVATLETEDGISTTPRTASAVGETGLVEENRVTAPSMRDAFKSSAEGTGSAPATPDASTDNNLGQTIDVAALQQQQLQLMQQRQFGIGVA